MVIFRVDTLLSLTTGTIIAVRLTGITKKQYKEPLSIHSTNLQQQHNYRSSYLHTFLHFIHALTHWFKHY